MASDFNLAREVEGALVRMWHWTHDRQPAEVKVAACGLVVGFNEVYLDPVIFRGELYSYPPSLRPLCPRCLELANGE